MKTYKWIFLVLVAGVFAGCSGDSEPELIGDWLKQSTKEGSGVGFASSFVIGDKGYVACGFGGVGRVQLKDVYAFDHTVNPDVKGGGEWTQKADFPGIGRQKAVGFSLTVDGKTYGFVGTGYDGDETALKDFWRYDPDKDRTNENAEIGPDYEYPDGEHPWEQIAPLPRTAKARSGAIAFTLEKEGRGFGYVGFGFTEYSDNRQYLLDMWEFDPKGTTVGDNGETLFGQWKVAPAGKEKRGGASVFVLNNKAYICNGENNSSNVRDFWVFDGYQWEQKRTMWNANPDEDFDDDYNVLPRANGVAYVAMVNGQLRGHIVGGKTNSSNWEYDHIEDLWVQRTYFYNNQYKESREGMISFSFPDGKAFVGMGRGGSQYLDDLWEFFPMVDDYIYNDF